MAIRDFYSIFSASLLLLIIFAGCVSNPPAPSTLGEYRRAFINHGNAPKLLAGDVLTLDNAIKTALVNNPTNRAAFQSVCAAKYAYYQALSAYLPEVNATYSLGHTLSRGWDLKNPPEGMLTKNDHFITTGALRATFLLFDGFARELESIIAYQEYGKSIETAKNVRRLLIRAVAFAFYDMYLAEEEIKIHSEDLDFQTDALRQEEQRFRSGHVSKASVLNFKILAARAKSNIANARYRKKVALHALTSLMGCDNRNLPGNIALEKFITTELPYIHDDEFYLEMAINNRPDLKAERMVLDIASRKRQKVYSEFLPQILLFSEFSLETYHAKYGNYRFSSARGNQRGFSYGAEGRWNIFQGFNSYNKLKRQEILERVAMWGLNSKFLEIAAEVKDACSNCKNARFQIGVFQSMAQWVREQRDLVYSEYRNGRETITRLNEAQSTLIEARSQLVISEIRFKKATAQLAAATGTDTLANPAHGIR